MNILVQMPATNPAATGFGQLWCRDLLRAPEKQGHGAAEGVPARFGDKGSTSRFLTPTKALSRGTISYPQALHLKERDKRPNSYKHHPKRRFLVPEASRHHEDA